MYQYIVNRIQIYGFCQLLKVLSIYFSRKMLDTIFGRTYSISRVAKKNGIEIIQTDSLKHQWFLNKLKNFSLDTIISISSTLIFRDALLSLPRLGCINLHTGKLPKYRGVSPGFWTLLNQEKECAVTVHVMNEKYDDGDILQQDVFDLTGIDTIHKMHLKVIQIAPRTILNSLVALDQGKKSTIKNDSSQATYFSHPTKEDGKKLRALGIKFI